jgi:hypothetical protein
VRLALLLIQNPLSIQKSSYFAKMLNNFIKVNRPEPVKAGIEPGYFTRESDIPETIQALLEGGQILVEEFYSNGLYLLRELTTF